MSTIHVLDDSTINKIAAGEVVERPASVIKELIENAIDAGASRIEIEIMAGGTSFMRVTDNGKGMSYDDAKLAILRHATSKITAVSDLNTLGTLGFRGEALPTIAAVSRFSLLTRTAGADLGTRIDIIGGQKPVIEEAGCQLGTTIKVEDLFFNTPARKKFLKTNHTEGAKINDFIVKLALSRPDIEFRFINNNKTAVVTPGNGNLYDTIQAIYGNATAESLLALDLKNDAIKISGFITKPSMLKSSRAWQTYIVNDRIIQNRAIAKAIDNAYKSLIPKSGFPLVVLKLAVPQRSIDVNVHPQKSEMKFEDEGLIFKAVYKSVLDAIRSAGNSLDAIAAVVEKPRPEYVSYDKPVMEPMHFVPAAEAPAKPADFTPKTIYEAVNRPANSEKLDFAAVSPKIPNQRQIDYPAKEDTYSSYEQVADGKTKEQIKDMLAMNAGEPAAAENAENGMLIPIGQVDLTYIIAQDAKGLYIIDQHAAHERILFDKLAAMADGIPSQQLLMHQMLAFDTKETELIASNKDLFGKLGFQMEPSGDNEYRLMEVPADIKTSEAEDIIREILTSLAEMHTVSAKEIRQACLATTACRAAIKAGEKLNLRQMQLILDELMHTPFPYTCPHGRPTILKFSSEELAKMFKRTGFGF